ncbi:Chitin-binding domain protein [Pyrenophora teres f. maculata]|nr:Chitin-binding domain protein [Pyrenophora teres f. maculata]
MHFTTTSLLALAVPTVLGHGLITSPPSRPVGPAIIENCGPKVEQDIRLDNTSHVEGLPELAAKDPAYNATSCNLFLCKGLQFADNPSNHTQMWTAGQVVPIKVWIRVPHEGSANVSIVDTKTNTIVGEMLKVWESGYAPGSKESDVPVDQKEFTVTVPEGLEERCKCAGDCVLQWWWFGDSAKQTYESCVDFKIMKKGVKRDAFARAFAG